MSGQIDAIKALIDNLPSKDRENLLAGYTSIPASQASMRLFRPAEAARVLGISTTTLWRLRKEGRIAAVLVRRGSKRIPEAAIRSFVEGRA
jgi:excisionase family DNA binding protein